MLFSYGAVGADCLRVLAVLVLNIRVMLTKRHCVGLVNIEVGLVYIETLYRLTHLHLHTLVMNMLCN